MTAGERIKERRLELGLSQDELARRLGLKGTYSRSTISKLERLGNNITTDRIREVAKALECTPAYLMGWETATPETKADAAVEIISNPELLHYVEKLLALDDAARNQIYSLIDLLSK